LQLLPPVLSGLINSDIGFKIELHRIWLINSLSGICFIK
jgi:hypothetical protein